MGFNNNILIYKNVLFRFVVYVTLMFGVSYRKVRIIGVVLKIKINEFIKN